MKSIKAKHFYVTILLSFLAMLSYSVKAQSRSYICEQINKLGECRNVAITQNHGNVILVGVNGWVADENSPSTLKRGLRILHDADEEIVDVCIDDATGGWIITYGRNGFRWAGIPESLTPVLHQCHNDNEKVTTVSFRKDGEWVVVTENFFDCSNPDIFSWILEGSKVFGKVITVTLAPEAIVVIYENGFDTSGEVPLTLIEALAKSDFKVRCVKVSGDAWFISDGEGRYNYLM